MQVDVIVAGMGIHGLLTTYMLASRGMRVVGLDSHDVPHPHGSSHGLTRVHRRAYFEAPFYVPLLKRADELWDKLGNDIGSVHFSIGEGGDLSANLSLLTRTGVLVIGPDDGRLARGALASAEEHRIHVKVFGPREAMELWPGLHVPEGHLAVLEPLAGVLLVEQAMERIWDMANSSGATCVHRSPVTSWEADGNGVVVHSEGFDEPLRARQLVIACGPWLNQVAGTRLPLSVERQYQVQFRGGTDAGYGAEDFPAIAIDRGNDPMLYGIPDFGNGIKLAFHHGGRVGSPADIGPVTAPEISSLYTVAMQWLPALPQEVGDSWTCTYTNTPDEHFIIDWHPEHGNVLLLSCCSGHGYKFAPVVGEIASQLLLDGGSSHDISRFSLDRFSRD